MTTFSTSLDTPFFTGTSASSPSVPGYLPIAIDGQPFMIDPSGYRRETVEVLRAQADQSDEPGESSLNPHGLWRRTQESWHHGAGQRFLDGKDSDRARYKASKGVGPWSEGHLSLLAATAARRAGASVGHALTVGGYLYVTDGTTVVHTTDPTVASPTWVSADIQAGQPAQTVQSIATDGFHVWAALGTSGLHRTDRGATTSTADAPSQACTLVAYAMGRLLIANANSLWEVTSPLGVPVVSLVMTHANTDFAWTVVGPGRNVIYAAGNSGGNAEVYRIELAQDTTLDTPTFATYLPDGETIHALQFYAGSLLLGTSKGLRLAAVDSGGNIDYGPLVETTSAVRCLEPQGRFAWYGATNYDSASTGLGRADLGYLTAPLTPAWATDLMATGQGDVISAVTFGDRRYFTVSGLGLYGETADKVTSGTLETGDIRFGTTERKTARSLDLRHHLLDGAVSVEVSYDQGDWESIGSSTVADTAGPETPLSARDESAESINLRFTLARDTVDTTAGPELVRWTFKALPTPRREEAFTLPILMSDYVDNMAGDGVAVYQDIVKLIGFLKDIEQSGRVVTLQVGDEAWSVFIDQSSHRGERWVTGGGGYRPVIAGQYLVRCQTAAS